MNRSFLLLLVLVALFSGACSKKTVSTTPGTPKAALNIEEIDFSHNDITEVPEAIFDFPNLKIIAMFNNPWTKSTWEMIRRKTEELRKKEDVFVHISEEEAN